MQTRTEALASTEQIVETVQGYDTTARPLWEIACELSAQVPEVDLEKVPSDASTNMHHYLYNAPRIAE